ncbi:GNAT family N-acetyltransferase [Enterococcus ratti]|uniref:GNAT family acetyltransferase n=1 Tax=Enterococcus ratti TaxID=150033 RepID=A0A1L8WK28_9ENTE|nr:GNAT family N-acetyltransferase [Enterococcus ratti]OJG81142.1 GNAT family acetyltransferase [Enterococcus ratti]
MKIVHTKDTLSDIYLDAVRIRNQVFVVEQGVSRTREIDRDEAQCIHFVLYSEKKQPCGTVRLLPLENGKIKLQRMAILPKYRHQGLGKILVAEAEVFAKQQGYNTVLLGAQTTAKTFYEKLGFGVCGDIFEEAGLPHISMKKEF